MSIACYRMSFIMCALAFQLSSFSVQGLCSNLQHVSPHLQTLHPQYYIARTSCQQISTSLLTFLPVAVPAIRSVKSEKNIAAFSS